MIDFPDPILSQSLNHDDKPALQTSQRHTVFRHVWRSLTNKFDNGASRFHRAGKCEKTPDPS